MHFHIKFAFFSLEKFWFKLFYFFLKPTYPDIFFRIVFFFFLIGPYSYIIISLLNSNLMEVTEYNNINIMMKKAWF